MKRKNAMLKIAMILAGVIVGTMLLGFAMLGLYYYASNRSHAQFARIDFYGRIVNEKGKGIPGVEIQFIVTNRQYDWLRHRIYEERKDVTVVTDLDGNFSIEKQLGTYVRIWKTVYRDKLYDLKALGIDKNDDPGWGVDLENRTLKAKLPNEPSKRVTYEIIKH